MTHINKVFDKNDLLAIFFPGNMDEEGIQFFTDSQNPLQIGMHNRKKGLSLKPHIHKLSGPLEIKSVQEILLVLKGKIRVNIFSMKSELLASRMLSVGESVLLISGGHGVDFIEDSIVYEVKQGPYPGVNFAKLYLQSDTLKKK